MIREQVKQAYPGKAWHAKVGKMTDNQVFAIYSRLKRQGKILGDLMKFLFGVVVGATVVGPFMSRQSNRLIENGTVDRLGYAIGRKLFGTIDRYLLAGDINERLARERASK